MIDKGMFVAAGVAAPTSQEFAQLRQLLFDHSGISLGEGKQQLICTRLARRLRALGYVSFGEYCHHLRALDPDGVELKQMLNAMTTNKTSFFRETHHFSFLRDEAVLQTRDTSRKGVRIWSAACSTGEEPYSILMTLLAGPPRPWLQGLRLLASDLDTEVLADAEAGVYTEAQVQAVPPPLLKRYFAPGRGQWEGHYRARRELRERVAFRRINFQDPQWPIHTRFDCVFCRNVMIYFTKETQDRLVSRLVDHLRPGGYLILGHAEAALGQRAGLKNLGRTIYQKAESSAPPGGRASP